jgi:hypothetical protein
MEEEIEPIPMRLYTDREFEEGKIFGRLELLEKIVEELLKINLEKKYRGIEF